MVGRTVLTGVSPGQDSSPFSRQNGFGVEFFYVGEAVSVARRKTIGEFLQISTSGMTLEVGSGATKTVEIAQGPNSVSKLLGNFYLLLA